MIRYLTTLSLLAGALAACGSPDDIHWAASHGRADRVKSLLAQDASLARKTGKDMMTPLHLASSAEVVTLLLDAGADIGVAAVNGQLPVHTVKDVGALETLLTRGADVNAKDGRYHSPLANAVKDADPARIKLLLARGADGRTALLDAGFLTKIGALSHAAMSGHRDTAEALLDGGFPADGYDKSDIRPLHCAVLADEEDLAALLVSKGADVNAPMPSGVKHGSKNVSGMTPLQLAGSDAMRELLKKGGATQ